ncbi:hypothetical protein PG991_001399 [Apiospora marii]|uniref:Uncharacterized protein n=1 Tax=Apiospora marii TaxID=335849 RepID=A0ABR1STS2_9PEZI
MNTVPSDEVRVYPRETQRIPSPRTYETRKRSSGTVYNDSVGGIATTQPIRDGGEAVAVAVKGRNAKSRRRGHIDRMSETLLFFEEELKEAQEESDEDEEFLGQVDAMKRVLDKLSQKMENLKLLATPKE